MLDGTVSARIAHLKIVTKKLMDGPLAGDTLAARRGYGIEFHQVRDYYVGDDVRFIDWRGSARCARLLVKECVQERNRRIIIALDVSASTRYGSLGPKLSWMKDIAAMLAFAGDYAKDAVGLVLFSDHVVCEVAPHTTQAALQHLLHTLYAYDGAWGCPTDFAALFNHVAQRWSKDAVVIVISDFIGSLTADIMRLRARVDLVAVRCLDRCEQQLPQAGLVLCDAETGQQLASDCAGKTNVLADRITQQDFLFASQGVACTTVHYGGDLCEQLITFFRKRLLETR